MIDTLWLAFIIKHFICDYPLQAFPWMYRNKGTYGHPGGIVHAIIQGQGTFWALIICGIDPWLAMWANTFDSSVHYHIDFAKMNIGKKFNLKPDNSELFWILLGFDQLLHYLTYWIIIGYVTQ